MTILTNKTSNVVWLNQRLNHFLYIKCWHDCFVVALTLKYYKYFFFLNGLLAIPKEVLQLWPCPMAHLSSILWWRGLTRYLSSSVIENIYQNKCNKVTVGYSYDLNPLGRLYIFILHKLTKYTYYHSNVGQWNFQSGTKTNLIFIEMCKNFWNV